MPTDRTPSKLAMGPAAAERLDARTGDVVRVDITITKGRGEVRMSHLAVVEVVEARAVPSDVGAELEGDVSGSLEEVNTMPTTQPNLDAQLPAPPGQESTGLEPELPGARPELPFAGPGKLGPKTLAYFRLLIRLGSDDLRNGALESAAERFTKLAGFIRSEAADNPSEAALAAAKWR